MGSPGRDTRKPRGKGAGEVTPPRIDPPMPGEEPVPSRDGRYAPPPPSINLQELALGMAGHHCSSNPGGNMLTTQGGVAPEQNEVRAAAAQGKAVVTVADVEVRCLTSRKALRSLHQLFERSAVPAAERGSNVPTSGFWLAETPSEIRGLLSTPGAQALLAVDKEGRLLGAYLYHLGAVGREGKVAQRGFPSADRDLVKAVLRSSESPIPKGTRFGVGHMVVLDELALQLKEQDPDAPTRREIMTAFQAAMIAELRREGVPWLVGYVRTSPAPNAARSAHQAMGWEEIQGCALTYRYALSPGAVCSVQSQVLALDVNSATQDRLIAEAKRIQGIQFLDLDSTT